MRTLEEPNGRVFATDEARQQSRRTFIRTLKLTLLPFLTLMGVGLGSALAGAGVPGGVAAVCALVLAVTLPWIAVRALNRRLRFWFALVPEGLQVGPKKRGWIVPYDQVALVRESNLEEVGEDRYVEVTAGSKSAKILLNTEDVGACARAIIARCPCAVWVDERGGEHTPVALEGDHGSESARRAVRNLSVLRARYLQAVILFGVVFLLSLAGLAFVGAAFAGLVPADEGLRKGLGISSIFFTGPFGISGFLQFRQLRAWDLVCERFSQSVAAHSPDGEG